MFSFGCFIPRTVIAGASVVAILACPLPTTAEDAAAKPATPDPFSKLTQDAKRHDGLLPLYRKEDKLYAEIPQRLLDKEFFVTISIARGIGDRFLLGGLSWGDGDDWVWAFHKVDDKLQVIRKNVRFFADKGSPEAAAVSNAFTDSILYSVPILAKTPAGGHLIDLEKIFFGDLPKISNQLSGFSFARDRSTWANTKAFEDNVEIEVAAT